MCANGARLLMCHMQLLYVQTYDIFLCFYCTVSVCDFLSVFACYVLCLSVFVCSYLERLSSQLLQHKHKSKKLLQEIEDCSKKAEELNDQQLQLEEKLKWHTNRTKDVQKNVNGL